MRKTLCLALFIMILAACNTLDPPAPDAQPGPIDAQPPTETNAKWSDPATWGGNIPQAGAEVVIPKDKKVLLDVSPPPLAGLLIEGSLVFADKDLDLSADWIMVQGLLEIGTGQRPYKHKAVITLTGDDKQATPVSDGIGHKVLGVVGGHLRLHGVAKTSWTQLEGSLTPGMTSMQVENAAGWQVGDQLAIAPTDLEPYEVEELRITAINGNSIEFSPALSYGHYGEVHRYAGFEVDERAEVANLNRNILITSDAKAYPELGGHMIFREDSQIEMDSVEVTKMGQPGAFGRYSLHFHLSGDMTGSYIKNTSIHHTFQRGIVIHQADGVWVGNNVVFDVYGNAYYLEDGIEIKNTFEGNLAMLIRYTPRVYRLSQPDGDDRAERLAGFWITNSHNTFRNNHVAAVENGMGYWFVRRDRPLSTQEEKDTLRSHDSHKLPMLEFSGNVAHTISVNRYSPDGGKGAFNLGYGPESAGSCLRFDAGFPYKDDLEKQNASVTNFLGYKCRNAGIWDSNLRPIKNSMLVDVRTGALNAQGRRAGIELKDSLILSGSKNNPEDRDMKETLTRGPFPHTAYEICNSKEITVKNVTIIGDIEPRDCK